MIEVPAAKLRESLARVMRLVAREGQHVIVKRHGKGLVAIIPIGDWELLRAVEDKVEGDMVRKVLEDLEAGRTTLVSRDKARTEKGA